MPEPPPGAITEKEIQMLGTAIGAFAQPMAHAQEIVAVETTKQAKIIADATAASYRWFFILGLGVLVLAGVALFRGKENITETLVVALFSFLGGLGAGKMLPKTTP